MGNGCAGTTDTGTNQDPDPDSTKYADLTIGMLFDHPNYCEWCTESSVNCGSSEFERAGNGQGMCKCRALCNDGCCRKACRRVSYNGNPANCCSSGKKVLGKGQTCDPKYRTFGTTLAPKTDCNEHMVKFCGTGNNLLKNSKCREWYNIHKDQADSVVLEVCNNPKYINDPACACIKAAKEALDTFGSQTKIAVECIDNQCVNNSSALRTNKMRENKCNVVNCNMDLTDVKLILTGANSSLKANFIQNCHADNAVTNNLPAGNNPPAENNTGDKNDWANVWTNLGSTTSDDFSNMTPPAIVWTTIGSILFIICVVLAIIIWKRRD